MKPCLWLIFASFPSPVAFYQTDIKLVTSSFDLKAVRVLRMAGKLVTRHLETKLKWKQRSALKVQLVLEENLRYASALLKIRDNFIPKLPPTAWSRESCGV